MKKLSVFLVIFAVMLCCMKSEMAAVGTGVYQGEGIQCAYPSNQTPAIGANVCVINKYVKYHSMFDEDEYNNTEIEQQMGIMQNWGMKYIRVFDGPLMTGPSTMKDGMQSRIADFLTRAQNHGLTVIFEFAQAIEYESLWMHELYRQSVGDPEAEWETGYTEFTTVGRSIYVNRMKYIIQQCFASRSQNIIYSLYNEASYPEDFGTETEMRNASISWVNYACSAIHTVDTRSNHKITVSLLPPTAQTQAYWSHRWLWRPQDMNNSNIDIIDMHFYHMDNSVSPTQDFDNVFYWVSSVSKPVMIGEIGVCTTDANEKDAVQQVLGWVHQVRNNSVYNSKIFAVLVWSMAPFLKTVEYRGEQYSYPHYRLTDGYTGFTRMAVTLTNDAYVEPSTSANYSAYGSYVTSNIIDSNDATSCILTHVPSTSSPNEYIINFGQWYRFHKLCIVDNLAPFPSHIDVFVDNGGWQPFGSFSSSNPNLTSAEIVCSASGGWMSAPRIKIVVTGEYDNWSSLSEVYVNPATVINVGGSATLNITSPDMSATSNNVIYIAGSSSSATVSWASQNCYSTAVYVSIDGGEDSLWKTGSSGTQTYSPIQPGHSYRFRVYNIGPNFVLPLMRDMNNEQTYHGWHIIRGVAAPQ